MALRSALAIVLVISLQGPQAPPSRTIKGYETLQTWARAVHAHRPGQWDDAARQVAALSVQDYRETLADLAALRRLLSARGRQLIRYDWPVRAGAKPETRFRELHVNDVPAILGLREDDRLSRSGRDFELAVAELRPFVSRFMKVAAVMEADLAIFAPLRRETDTLVHPPGEVQHYIMKANDGSPLGSDDAPVHWMLGCAALDLVVPSPAADEFVRLWYRAGAAWQAQHRQYGYARPFLERAHAAVPDDPYLYFYSGVMLENIAAPNVQVVVQSLAESQLYSPGGSAGAALTAAETALRRAVALDPSLAVARLRLARVVSLKGRHDEAARELRVIVASLTRDVDRYYAQMFLGVEEQVLSRFDAARAAYGGASILFPRAQSPLLSLSQLAWQEGDQVSARASFLVLAGLGTARSAGDDPWWDYDISAVADAAEQLDRVRTLAVDEKEHLR